MYEHCSSNKVRQVKRTAGKVAVKQQQQAIKPVVVAATNAKWFWLMKNNPITWQEYEVEVAAVIEEGFVNKKKTIKIDEERFIDFENMLQRRIDNSARNRYIKRVGPIPVLV